VPGLAILGDELAPGLAVARRRLAHTYSLT
jgi:hypothetical protein